MIHFLVHGDADSVGVAVVDIPAGQSCRGVSMESAAEYEVSAKVEIPLGHKIAVVDLPASRPVIKYGQPIGLTTRDIAAGDHVHTHNLKTTRW